jgi:hypothetical protein
MYSNHPLTIALARDIDERVLADSDVLAFRLGAG